MKALNQWKAGALLAVLLTLSIHAFAATTQTFDRPGFEAAQKAGRPILVHIKATW